MAAAASGVGAAKGMTVAGIVDRARPICVALVVCERVLIEKDNVLSAIRIVDTLCVPPSGERALGQPVEFGNLTLLAIFKNAGAHGEFHIQLSSIGPSGANHPIGEAQGHFEGPLQGGGSIVVPLRLYWEDYGLYWIELTLENNVVARSPFRVDPPKLDDKPKVDEGHSNAD